MSYNKYGAAKARCNQNHIHDSKREAQRCNELTILERGGYIHGLKQQVKYMLIPAQYEKSTEVYKKGTHKGEFKRGKLIENECAYYADFDYTTNTGEHVVEDTKGMKTKDYIIKRKLMLSKYQIRIKEI